MKKFLLYIFALLLILGCSLTESGKDGSGAVSFNLSSSRATETLFYTISGSGPNSRTAFVSGSTGSLSFNDLTPGEWTFSAVVYDNATDLTILYTGLTSLIIESGKSISGNITLSPFGTGALELGFTWDEVVNPSLFIKLKNSCGAITTYELDSNDISESSGIISKSVSSGLYSVYVTLYSDGDYAGGTVMTSVLILSDYSVSHKGIVIPVSIDENLSSGTVYCLDGFTDSSTGFFVTGRESFSFAEISDGTIIHRESDSQCDYSYDFVDGYKVLNAEFLSSENLNPGKIEFVFTGAVQGYYTYTDGSDTIIEGEFTIAGKGHTWAELYLGLNPVSIIDFNDSSIEGRYVVDLEEGSEGIFFNPVNPYNPDTEDTIGSMTITAIIIDDNTKNGELNTKNPLDFTVTISTKEIGNFIFDFNFYSQYRGVVNYTHYLSESALSYNAPFTFDVEYVGSISDSDLTNYYMENLESTYYYDESDEDFWTLALSSYSSVTHDTTRLSFNPKYPGDYSLASFTVQKDDSYPAYFSSTILGEDSSGNIICSLWDLNTSDEDPVNNILGADGYILKESYPMFLLKYNYNDNSITLFDNDLTTVLSEFNDLQYNLDLNLTNYLYQNKNFYVLTLESQKFSDNCGTFAFSPGTYGNVDSSGIGDYPEYINSVISFTEHEDSSADLNLYVDSGFESVDGEYFIKFLTLDEAGIRRGVFKTIDANGSITEGVFNNTSSYEDSVTPMSYSEFTFNEETYNLSDILLQVEGSSSFEVEFTNDYIISIFDTAKEKSLDDVSFNVVGTYNNMVIIKVDSEALSNTTFSTGEWFIFDPDNSELKVGNDIIKYLETGEDFNSLPATFSMNEAS